MRRHPLMPESTMFAKIAASVAVGFLGAYPLASASGLMRVEVSREPSLIITISGIILFFVTVSLIGPTIRLIQSIVGTLKGIEERPKTSVSVTMLFLGTLCAISAMIIQLNTSRSEGVAMNFNAPGFNMAPQMALQSSGSFAPGLLTILTFLLGVALIGLGIWGSLKPATSRTGITGKPVIRDFDEAAV